MRPDIPEIGLLELAGGIGFIAIAGGVSAAFGLGLGRRLAIGTLRTFAQLFLMGGVLSFIFAQNAPLPTLGVYAVMILAAGQVIYSQVGRKSAPYLLPVLSSMAVSFTLVAVLVSGAIIGAEPWWSPRTFLPMAGMVIGNSMGAVAVSLERLFGELAAQRPVVEMLLAHGATPTEASAGPVRAAVRAGLLPSISSLMGVGLVFLPGMMTGQILAGADPLTAIRYQIVVMLMVVGSTALATVTAILLTRRRCFDAGGRLRR